MSFADTLKKLAGKGETYAAKHPDKVRGLVDKATQAVNKRTGGKYSGQIDKAAGAAEQRLDGETGGVPPRQ